ncbi:hypothetical protein WMY93_032764 [Mugilogobius chulae]|uniref:Uncharacterized protein n=1 Tax=Mugilogobius chulae TaxID=88201 RepID=A0AAW0MQY6_9GOBI
MLARELSPAAGGAASSSERRDAMSSFWGTMRREGGAGVLLGESAARTGDTAFPSDISGSGPRCSGDSGLMKTRRCSRFSLGSERQAGQSYAVCRRKEGRKQTSCRSSGRRGSHICRTHGARHRRVTVFELHVSASWSNPTTEREMWADLGRGSGRSSHICTNCTDMYVGHTGPRSPRPFGKSPDSPD